MSIKRIKGLWFLAAQEALITQMNHWMIYLAAMTFLGLIIHSSPDRTLAGLVLWKWMICSMVPFIYWLIRYYTERFWVLMGSHLLIAAACVWCLRGEILETAFLFLMMFRYMYASFDVRVETDDRMDRQIQPGAAGLIVGIGGTAQYFLGVRDWMPAYGIILMLYLALYFLLLYLERYKIFLKINMTEKGRVPARNILLHGLWRIFLFVGILSVISLLMTGNHWLDEAGNHLKERVAAAIFYLTFEMGVWVTKQNTVLDWQSGVGTPLLPDTGNDTPFYFWVVMERLVPIVFGILLALILVAVFIGYVRYVGYRLQRPFQRTEEQITDDVVDIRMKCIDKPKHKRGIGRRVYFSASERIRRIYRKEVWKRRAELGIDRLMNVDGQIRRLQVLTARECGRQLAREQLTQLYEKARYSDQECTGEDVKRAEKRSQKERQQR